MGVDHLVMSMFWEGAIEQEKMIRHIYNIKWGEAPIPILFRDMAKRFFVSNPTSKSNQVMLSTMLSNCSHPAPHISSTQVHMCRYKYPAQPPEIKYTHIPTCRPPITCLVCTWVTFQREQGWGRLSGSKGGRSFRNHPTRLVSFLFGNV